MPLTIINSFASWVLKQRIHQIELFLKYPNEVQEELLLDLIQSSKTTALQRKEYALVSIFLCNAKLNCINRAYHFWKQDLHKMVCQIAERPMPKVIPSSYVTKAARICVFVFDEINEEWVVGIPSEDNNTFGDLSAILIENMPIWAEFSSTPSNKISLMSEWKQNCCHYQRN
jgi:hypothetical protein